MFEKLEKTSVIDIKRVFFQKTSWEPLYGVGSQLFVQLLRLLLSTTFGTQELLSTYMYYCVIEASVSFTITPNRDKYDAS